MSLLQELIDREVKVGDLVHIRMYISWPFTTDIYTYVGFSRTKGHIVEDNNGNFKFCEGVKKI